MPGGRKQEVLVSNTESRAATAYPRARPGRRPGKGGLGRAPASQSLWSQVGHSQGLETLGACGVWQLSAARLGEKSLAGSRRE